ncbi:hypothetical protein PRSY57_1036500 [Plasmodium reichenowi]|uniref:RING-type E3 ubiquitin transferase n=1 Tax=Plasmodium reichenowi TaxID=5854 RepID=A0A151LFT3_PLARE|nr:hypothetical protein PRSY57_1036500 [Plasmodium reichenowi]KYN97814.1 hypothetical protein PRSY57_1036500 [Plasmodium reichenowi]
MKNYLQKCNVINKITKKPLDIFFKKFISKPQIKHAIFFSTIKNESLHVKKNNDTYDNNIFKWGEEENSKNLINDKNHMNGKNHKNHIKDKNGSLINNIKIYKQSELVRRIRKYCRKDDLCNIYRFADEFLDLLNKQEIAHNDFIIIIHLLSKKQFLEKDFWRNITNLNNINFIFHMNIKQIILFIYSIVNSFKYIHPQFLNIFTNNLNSVLENQKRFLLIYRKKNKIEIPKKKIQAEIQTNKQMHIIENKAKEHINLINNDYNEYKKDQLNNLLCNKNLNKQENKFPIYNNNINHLNLLDITLLCYSYSKLNDLHNLEHLNELKNNIYKLFVYFLFFYKNDFNHLILFLYSYVKLNGCIKKSILIKLKKNILLLTNNANLKFMFPSLYALNICSLNMLMNILHKSQFKDEHFFEEIILSVVINLNVSQPKRKKIKSNILNGNYDNSDNISIDNLINSYGYEIQTFNNTDMYNIEDYKEGKYIYSNNEIYNYNNNNNNNNIYNNYNNNIYNNNNNNIYNNNNNFYNNNNYCSYNFITYFKTISSLVKHFVKNKNTYFYPEHNQLVQLKKKDFCFLLYNVNKLNVKNYYNIYDYLKKEAYKQISILDIYNSCIVLNSLINLNILDDKIFNKLFTHLKILFDKNIYKEKDIIDIFVSLITYSKINYNISNEINLFLIHIYNKIEYKLKKYNFKNLLLIFFYSSYINIHFNNSILQDLCIDVLNNFEKIDIKYILIFLYLLKYKNYQMNNFFIDSLIQKVLYKLKGEKKYLNILYTYIFQIITVHSFQSLYNEKIQNMLIQMLIKNKQNFNLKEKIIISLHIYVNPILILNQSCLSFCAETFQNLLDYVYITKTKKYKIYNKMCTKEKNKDNKIYHHYLIKTNHFKKYINVLTNDTKNIYINDQRFYQFFLFFFNNNNVQNTHSNCNIDFNIDHINIKELHFFFFYLLVIDIIHRKNNLKHTKKTFHMLYRNMKKYSLLKEKKNIYINNQFYLYLCKYYQLNISFQNIYIKLNNDSFKYFLRNNNKKLFYHNKTLITYLDLNNKMKKHIPNLNLNNYSNKTHKQYNKNNNNNNNIILKKEKINIYKEDIIKYFPHFEETLFNTISIYYEDLFLYMLSQNKISEENIKKFFYQSSIYYNKHNHSSSIHDNGNIIIKMKKDIFINFFYIPYVFKPLKLTI